MSLMDYVLAFRVMSDNFTKMASERKELARQLYWDACKFPRKTKKKMRKKALADFRLYSMLEKPVIFK